VVGKLKELTALMATSVPGSVVKMAELARRRLWKCARPGSTHDELEGRREARELHRGLCGSLGIWRVYHALTEVSQAWDARHVVRATPRCTLHVRPIAGYAASA